MLVPSSEQGKVLRADGGEEPGGACVLTRLPRSAAIDTALVPATGASTMAQLEAKLHSMAGKKSAPKYFGGAPMESVSGHSRHKKPMSYKMKLVKRRQNDLRRDKSLEPAIGVDCTEFDALLQRRFDGQGSTPLMLLTAVAEEELQCHTATSAITVAAVASDTNAARCTAIIPHPAAGAATAATHVASTSEVATDDSLAPIELKRLCQIEDNQRALAALGLLDFSLAPLSVSKLPTTPEGARDLLRRMNASVARRKETLQRALVGALHSTPQWLRERA
jgi:hypothetical protein